MSHQYSTLSMIIAWLTCFHDHEELFNECLWSSECWVTLMHAQNDLSLTQKCCNKIGTPADVVSVCVCVCVCVCLRLCVCMCVCACVNNSIIPFLPGSYASIGSSQAAVYVT